MERNNQNKKKSLIIIVLLLFIIVVSVFLVKRLMPEPENEWDDSQSQSTIGQITYEGKQYSYNTNLTNILFMGIDNNDVIRNDDMPGEAGQTDCIMILTLDKSTKTAKILQIPRDTMTEVDVYNKSGTRFEIRTEQIATQYAYSTGGESSCFAVKQTVSELLYELPIDGYLAMDMASIAIVNDAIGGVTITIPEDYTMIDPAFVKGETLTLTGKQAHSYVRWRDTNASFSNYARMDRQVQYIPAMIDTMRKYMKENENYYDTIYSLVEKYMVTDLSVEQFEQLAEYELVTSEIQTIPGNAQKGKKYEEFYANEKELQKMLIETFYILEE